MSNDHSNHLLVFSCWKSPTQKQDAATHKKINVFRSIPGQLKLQNLMSNDQSNPAYIGRYT